MVDYVAAISNPNDAFMKARSYAEQLSQLSNQKSAGAQYAMGDRAGAGRTLAMGGDIAGAQGIEANEAKQLEAQQAYIRQAAPVLQQIYAKGGPQALLQAYDALGPDFQRLRMSPEEISGMRQRLATNPDPTLQVLGAIARGKITWQRGGDGRLYPLADTGQQAGEPVGSATQRPLQAIPVPQGGTVHMFDPNQPTGGAQPNPQPAPVMGSAAGAPSMPPAPVPQVPQTAAAPAVPQPMPPAAGAVQPSRPVVSPQAMVGATQPPRAPGSPTRAMPPLSAPASAGPEYSGAGAPNRQVAGGLGAPPQPESNLPGYLGSIRGPPKPAPPQFTPATAEQAAADPGLLGFKPDRTPVYRRQGTGTPTALAPQERKSLDAVRTLSRDARNIVRDMRQFIELNRRGSTGLMYNIPGSESLAKGRDPVAGQMIAIINRNVPRMRQGLPGAASDLDIQMFKAGAPSMTQTREANEAVAQQLITTAERTQAYAEFLEDWAGRHKTLTGAEEEWNAYDAANPPIGANGRRARVTPWRQWFANRPSQQQAPAAGDGWSIQRVQ